MESICRGQCASSIGSSIRRGQCASSIGSSIRRRIDNSTENPPSMPAAPSMPAEQGRPARASWLPARWSRRPALAQNRRPPRAPWRTPLLRIETTSGRLYVRVRCNVFSSCVREWAASDRSARPPQRRRAAEAPQEPRRRRRRRRRRMISPHGVAFRATLRETNPWQNRLGRRESLSAAHQT